MLTIKTPIKELWDEERECFIYLKEQTIRLEHSLVSISKWESKWHKPFLDKKEKSIDEEKDYIQCMCIDDDVDIDALSNEDIEKISKYIEDPMTASIVNDISKKNNSGKFVTSELIYYWMVSYGIPFECEHWHLNRLIMLIRICNAENQDPKSKKMSANEITSRNKELNEKRKKQFNTKG